MLFNLNIAFKGEVPNIPTRQMQEEQARQCVEAITAEVLRQWKIEASKGLGSTKAIYCNSLNVIDNGPLFKTVILQGSFANKIEQGAAAFDMKEGFSKSSKAKKSKSGWYLHIPFSYSLNQSSIDVGTEVLAAIANAKVGDKVIVANDTNTVREAFSSMQTKKTYETYISKSVKYEGLIKKSNTDATTFRTVSNKSVGNSWIHPGFEKRDFLSKALQKVDVSKITNLILQ